MEPLFLTLDEVLRIHEREIEAHGGGPGLLNRGLLESAVAQPATAFGGHFAHADLAEMAGAYLFHLAKNHCFVDGNKRVAALSAVVFLALNGVDFDVPPNDYYYLTYGVASGTVDKADAADFFRRRGPARAGSVA
jgi:death-on-curing protein